MTGAITESLLDAIRAQESGGNDCAVSPVGAKGAYQLMDATGREWHRNLKIKDPYDPFNEPQARRIARAYLLWLLKRAGGDLEKCLLYYHTGIGNVDKGKVGPVGKAYAASVLKRVKGKT